MLDYRTARDLIDILADLWPQCFAVYEARRRPLKLGIRADIVATGAVTEEEAAAALRLYCSNRGYLRHCRVSADRIDLNGDRAGIVTMAEAANSRASLQAREAKRMAEDVTGTAAAARP
jgi:sRNA-binding protein